MLNFEKKLMENQNRNSCKKSWVVSSGDGTMNQEDAEREKEIKRGEAMQAKLSFYED